MPVASPHARISASRGRAFACRRPANTLDACRSASHPPRPPASC
ncbi:hypothetical protein CZ774_13530 [Frigoribacterium sp. JB110]|nr:hypothetical protein CZ774_13530 [Frigoribacterium sp. JB110]